MFLAKAFTDAGKGRIRQSLTALVNSHRYEFLPMNGEIVGECILTNCGNQCKWERKSQLLALMPAVGECQQINFSGIAYWRPSHKWYFDGILNSTKFCSALIQNVISDIYFELELSKFCSNFEFDRNIVSGMVAWAPFHYLLCYPAVWSFKDARLIDNIIVSPENFSGTISNKNLAVLDIVKMSYHILKCSTTSHPPLQFCSQLSDCGVFNCVQALILTKQRCLTTRGPFFY